MDLNNLAIGMIFLLQSTVGILGNFSLLFYYLTHYCTEQKLKTKDYILTNLFTANCLVFVSSGMLKTIHILGTKLFISDFSCQLLLYIERLGRSMSIGLTCLLSVFQAITLSPNDSCWKNVKFKAPKYIKHSIFLCWFLYMTVNMIFPMYLYITGSSKNITHKRDLKYCFTTGNNDVGALLYTAFCAFPEVLLSVIIAWTGGYMIVILYMHKQQVLHIHSTHVFSSGSPESRATQNILILEFTFLGFYALSSVLQGWNALLYNTGLWQLNITAIISLCFPTLGPFILSRNSIVLKFFFCMKNQNST